MRPPPTFNLNDLRMWGDALIESGAAPDELASIERAAEALCALQPSPLHPIGAVRLDVIDSARTNPNATLSPATYQCALDDLPRLTFGSETYIVACGEPGD